MTIKFATTNIGKFRELQSLLKRGIVQFPLDLLELQGIEVDDIVRFKAEQAYKVVGSPVLVEDTGLAFSAWNGLPGALIRWFLDSVGSQGICRILSEETNRHAIAKCTLDFYDGYEHHLFSGIMQGTLAKEPRGYNGFGWDNIFIPEEYDQTLAEMTTEQKSNISIIRLASDKLQKHLDDSTIEM
ncbi:non-canonical purine NTP pyrophosphatase, RdgB/HAM1 family [Reticulibacter mediterranei]|uniref:Non-canonical purine NTP pyrophosphatase, RdgB/HAM1 family n=1 Tax=Reticulibacter mediterranei TaxID=2778369 RepID=A0A8J3N019_9CHLR|nr:non-canonical purine NTP pyrophosphatase [Reticulibacter mediterranei]GHO90790.1 non-canonical purine NTP pyrophosphatase, RdgB/HAM1 family [Reticulibacter mediterranei]